MTDQSQLDITNETIRNRFWGRVDKSDDCWTWTGPISSHGYGVFWVDGQRHAAHRVSYRMTHGDIPQGLVIDHVCHGADENCPGEDNWCRHRACVNPDHLEAVTERVNLLRGRGVSGEAARRTHCPQGHPYDAANTVIWGKTRRCRACRKAKEAATRTSPPPAERTHCPQGHPYSEENTYQRPNGSRTCRTCKRQQDRKARRAAAEKPGRKAPVLPAPVDRAAVLREAADDLVTAFGDPMVKHIGVLGASHLRRRAREVEAAQRLVRHLFDEAQQPGQGDAPVYDETLWDQWRRDAKCRCTAPSPANCARYCTPSPHGTRECPCHYLSRMADEAQQPEEAHVVADSSDDPEHVDDCPGCPAP
jgi:hypothetical protein